MSHEPALQSHESVRSPRRGRLARRGLLVLLASLLLVLPPVLWKVSKSRTFQFFGKLHARVPTAKKVVALTFDDGPTPAFTKPVLVILKRYKARATFFVTGREMARYPAFARMLVEAGHELGNHSFSHRRMLLLSPGRARRELDRTDALIRKAGHKGEIHFRPPYCKKLFVLPYILSQRGTRTITWDVEPESFPAVSRSAKGIQAHVVERVKPGSIVLLHVMVKARETSRQALPGILHMLHNKGYSFVTISQLLQLASRE